jgi:hypothetical protein
MLNELSPFHPHDPHDHGNEDADGDKADIGPPLGVGLEEFPVD